MNKNIAVVYGSGAVEKAWEPVLKAFQMIWGDQVDENDANFLFAKEIYLLRIYSCLKDELSKRNLKDIDKKADEIHKPIGQSHQLLIKKLMRLSNWFMMILKVLNVFIYMEELILLVSYICHQK